MTKKLPTSDMVNELAGASVFFQAKTEGEPAQAQPIPGAGHEASNHDTMQPRHQDTALSSHHPTKEQVTQLAVPPTNHSVMLSPTQNDNESDMLEEVRKMVRQQGKEAATHRFTPEEKRAIADLVYTYHRQGYRTSENEITRIAVNWLLMDFKERGAQSVLARMLELIHA